jgi:hypothetical protein
VSSCFLSVRFSLLSSCYCPGSRRATLSIGSRGVLCSSEWTCSSFGTVLGNRRVCGAFLARPCVGIRGSGGMDGVLLVREWRMVHSCAGWRCEVRDLRAGVVEDGWWKELVGD